MPRSRACTHLASASAQREPSREIRQSSHAWLMVGLTQREVSLAERLARPDTWVRVRVRVGVRARVGMGVRGVREGLHVRSATSLPIAPFSLSATLRSMAFTWVER